MKKIFFFLVCIVNMQLLAQEEKLRVTLNVGNPIEFNINQIKDITFFEETAPLNLVGEWFCYNEENDIYESFELYEDGTLFYHCYNLLENETAKGRWAFRDGMLGLNYMNNNLAIPIIGHSETSFSLYINNKKHTYFKVQKTYQMSTADAPISIGNNGDVVTYVDNTIIGLDGTKIKALQQGTGYALVNDANLNTLVAYRVNVSYTPGKVIDWTKFFKKTKADIIAELGSPNATQMDASMGELVGYTKGYNAEIKQLTFIFDKDSGRMYMVQAVFRGYEELMTYEDDIKKNYIFKEEVEKTRYYTDSSASTSISVRFKTSPYFINYMDLSE